MIGARQSQKNHLIVGTVKDVRAPVYKSESITGPDVAGTRSVPDGHEVADIQVLVDVRALVADLGRKAMRSRSLSVKLRGGAVVIKAINVRRVALAGASINVPPPGGPSGTE